MKPVPAYMLAHSRREARQDARTAIEFKAAQERALKRSNEARSVFRDAVASLDLPMFQADAVIAAAECMAKADVVAAGMPAPFVESAIAPPTASISSPKLAAPDRQLIEHQVSTTAVRLAELREARAPDLLTIDWLERLQSERRASLGSMDAR